MKYRQAVMIGLCLSALMISALGKPGSSGGKSSSKSSKAVGFLGHSKPNTQQNANPNADASKVNKASTGSILSAWGIISLILFVIVGSALVYYISIFYPLICAKRGKYDVMEMTAV